ncbi:solute carrier family 12 member 2 [Exophiala viscosa]|uniref:Solute carrier family 12 member 2 n=1 Tax=Exophiala viscosa TaxID=2486360 RepID=A0AAN6DXW7_9EURO|nr:solute carrier family 12 member 2 [Exophiala viscosa]KAI1621270.1 solute carrier family 12 member 2 [Exophiala viscosa]
MADTGGRDWPSNRGRGTLPRSRPTFSARTATDDAAQLMRRSSFPTLSNTQERPSTAQGNPSPAQTPSRPTTARSAASSPFLTRTETVSTTGGYGTFDGLIDDQTTTQGSVLDQVVTQQDLSNGAESAEKAASRKIGSLPRPVGGTDKLGTFSGVFVPTSLNVLSILMFIRFGFILGQSGVLGMLAMLIIAYAINLLTTMSISAVASNGTVRGGGAYYLIARSLGPEFGGAIGLVSYAGFVFNTGMNAVGLIDCLIYNFGSNSGEWANTLPEGGWWQFLWSSVVLVVCLAICLGGSAIFARASNLLLFVLLLATFSIPFSAIIVSPFQADKHFTRFTGFSIKTLRENLMPHFTRGASGSQLRGKENYQDLFGILFPATGGILAGASMSGDLKNPSESIPRGTLGGLALTFISYSVVILGMAASITRESFYKNVNVVQDTNVSGILILVGEIATTFFSVLMGIIGPAKQLQAIARDKVIPGLSVFGQGTEKSDDPIYALLCTFAVAQLTLLLDINRIASLITMTYLMTFFALNVATFLLRIGSAPNFRPSFHYFNWWTAAAGALLSIASMFFVDGIAASGSVCILLILIVGIHYTTPPKPWGSISEVLIYHQVRKYLLRLRTEHVKFWRPQILLFVNDPRRGYKLIQFCNSLKKGALFIIGHVIVTQNFGDSVPEARRQQAAWNKFIDVSRIKAFVNVAISPSIEWGARNIFLSAGLGGMRPNIVVFGFYNLQQFRNEQPLVDVPSPPPERKHGSVKKRRSSRNILKRELPTDSCYIEKRTDVQSYVMVLEDMILKLKTNVAIAAGFADLELPKEVEEVTKKYIDLWPIQMSAEITSDEEGQSRNLLTTNFDTYTLILQLGCILNTVPSWKRVYKLRVAVFVEYESDVEDERVRVTSLLGNLRIEAQVLVFWLACGAIKSYNFVVNGEEVEQEVQDEVNKVLEDEVWWQELQVLRGQARSGDVSAVEALTMADDIVWPSPSFNGRREASVVRLEGLKKFLARPRKRSSLGNLSNLGVSLSMRTSRLDDDMLSRHASHPSDSEMSQSDEDESDEDGDSAISRSEDEAEDEELSPMGLRSPKKPKMSSKKSSLASSKKRRRRKKNVESEEEGPSSMHTAFQDFGESDHRGRTDSILSRGDNSLDTVSPRSSLQLGSSRRGTSPNFTSTPVPLTKVASEEGAGPSIMFADTPRPPRPKVVEEAPTNGRSIYQRTRETSIRPKPTSGYPAAASIPLSFNDLPSRAQHLILNELISQNSEDTAVIFTTLPAPVEATYKSETDSLGYVSDLEVLVGGLPPTLLVHSNSMTVTTNL